MSMILKGESEATFLSLISFPMSIFRAAKFNLGSYLRLLETGTKLWL